MAPELARGKAVDRRADIWAFGVVLYEMRTGRRLFDGDDASDVLAAVLRQDVDWTALPADVPAGVYRVLRRCLDRDQRKRLGAIGDARFDLDEPERAIRRLRRIAERRLPRAGWIDGRVPGVRRTGLAALRAAGRARGAAVRREVAEDNRGSRAAGR
jgi:serine/threonine-protein kinase